MKSYRFELHRDRQKVASSVYAIRADALQDIMHFASYYEKFGPVIVYERVGKKLVVIYTTQTEKA